MIGPYTEYEINEFDALEEVLIDRQVPLGRIMKMYSEFCVPASWLVGSMRLFRPST